MTDTIELDDETALALAAARARRRLQEAPGLVAFIRTLVVPSMGGAKDGMPRAASKEPPAPMHVDAEDDSNTMYAQLVNWVSYWGEQLSVRPPASLTAVWRNGSDVQGFSVTATPPGAGQLVQILVTWLLIRHDEIARHPGGRAYLDDVSDPQGVRYDDEGNAHWYSIRSRYPRAPRRPRDVEARQCPVCGEYAVGAVWHSEDVHDVIVQCEGCTYEVPTKTYQQVLDWIA